MRPPEAARLAWRDGQPFATDYNDIYHAPDGAAEVERVFLAPAAFDEMRTEPGTLLVGELGFGTGLNFAVIADACVRSGKPLHFVSFDCAPLAAADFARIAAERRRQLPVYTELAEVYPPLLPGWHRRVLADGLITLSVFWGDAAEGVHQLRAEQRRAFRLWLLDGFAPDRNPALWTPELMQDIAALSRTGTQVTTFTAAGRVRRALSAAGFDMRRVDQRPHKRESLAGRFARAGLTGSPPARPIHIAGAGLAGASVARHLAEAGLTVRVYDPRGIAAGASGIPATVLHGRLQGDLNEEGLLRANAYLYARAYCRRFDTEGALRQLSALQVPSANYPVSRLEQVAAVYATSGRWLSLVDAVSARAESGLPLDTPLLRFADAAVVNTPQLCRSLLAHPNIELIPEALPAPDPTQPRITVLACAAACQSFPEAAFLEIAAVSGQVDLFTSPNPQLAGLDVAMVGNGYLVRTAQGLMAGASYEYRPWPEAQASANNQRYLAQFAGDLARDARWLQRFRGERCVSSDRLPIAGLLADSAHQPLPDLYVSSGHGSMGTVSAHLAAALISAAIIGDFVPLSPAQQQLLSPLRFRLRQAKRGYRMGADS